MENVNIFFKKTFFFNKKEMAGIYGIDPIFTYTYKDTSFNRINSCIKKFEPEKDTLMYYLEENNPIFSSIIKMANYIGVFSDRQFRGTLFLPSEESLKELDLGNLDINTCRKLIEYHYMEGFYPKNILLTSPFQQLQTKIKGQSITAGLYINRKNNEQTLLLDKTSYITEFDIRLKNAFIHLIDRPLPFPNFI